MQSFEFDGLAFSISYNFPKAKYITKQPEAIIKDRLYINFMVKLTDMMMLNLI